jgi:hypothetical protein
MLICVQVANSILKKSTPLVPASLLIIKDDTTDSSSSIYVIGVALLKPMI